MILGDYNNLSCLSDSDAEKARWHEPEKEKMTVTTKIEEFEIIRYLKTWNNIKCLVLTGISQVAMGWACLKSPSLRLQDLPMHGGSHLRLNISATEETAHSYDMWALINSLSPCSDPDVVSDLP